jgi:hypothetical protein
MHKPRLGVLVCAAMCAATEQHRSMQGTCVTSLQALVAPCQSRLLSSTNVIWCADCYSGGCACGLLHCRDALFLQRLLADGAPLETVWPATGETALLLAIRDGDVDVSGAWRGTGQFTALQQLHSVFSCARGLFDGSTALRSNPATASASACAGQPGRYSVGHQRASA